MSSRVDRENRKNWTFRAGTRNYNHMNTNRMGWQSRQLVAHGQMRSSVSPGWRVSCWRMLVGPRTKKILCWRTAPTWDSTASMTREIGTEGIGWTNLGTQSRAGLAWEKDCSMTESLSKLNDIYFVEKNSVLTVEWAVEIKPKLYAVLNKKCNFFHIFELCSTKFVHFLFQFLSTF